MGRVDELHLLVLGSPRSGTTLLAAMLGSHPEIAVLNEDTHGSSRKILSKRIRGVKLCIPNQIELEHTVSMRLGDAALGFLQQRVLDPVRGFLRVRRPVPIGRKSRLSIRDYERQMDSLHIVGILRSPRDVVASIMRRGQQTRRTAEYRWRRTVEVLFELSRAGGNAELTVVSFDSLVTDPARVMGIILERLGCDFNEEVLEGYKHTPYYVDRPRIDATKASTNLGEAGLYPLLEQDSNLRMKYEFLIGQGI